MHYIQFPDLTRGSLARRLYIGAAEKKATIDPACGRNRTCGLAIPVQRSSQLSDRVQLTSINYAI